MSLLVNLTSTCTEPSQNGTLHNALKETADRPTKNKKLSFKEAAKEAAKKFIKKKGAVRTALSATKEVLLSGKELKNEIQEFAREFADEQREQTKKDVKNLVWYTAGAAVVTATAICIIIKVFKPFS